MFTKIQLGLRHRPSGRHVRSTDDSLSFADYVAQTREMLDQAHAGMNDAEKVVEGNAPFEFCPASDLPRGRDKPYRRGVLLTHGLSDSPYHMRHLAIFFQRNGFRVMAVLLPGHGTQPGDLLDVHWQDWAKTVAFGADRLAEEVEEVYLAGFSAGAALSVYHAAKDERVRGLFLFSPAFEITVRAKWAKLHKLYSWLLSRTAWVNISQDQDPFKYESFCKNAAAQMHGLTKALPQQALSIPVFAAASADDATVSSAATLRFMQHATHHASRLVWYSKEKLEQKNIEWVNSAMPEQRILSSAHTAIVIPAEDAHYGAAGKYLNCLHYRANDDGRYALCMNNKQVAWLGEVDERNLQQGLLRRLTFNPHYAQMEASMQRFIESLP
ncbi:MAG: alpha/beta fold hydrolase [Gallionella sp.]|nr:alpha/beta fold hydrolase [Gallionella sp.]